MSGSDSPGKYKTHLFQLSFGQVHHFFKGSFPEHQARQIAHVPAGFTALENKTAAPACNCIFQHHDGRRMQVGFGAGGFQFLDLGRNPAGKQGKGNFILFNQFKMLINGLIEGFNTDQPGPETGQFFLAPGQNFFSQINGQAGQGQKGKPSVFQNLLRKFRRIADIGHGPLDDRIQGVMFFCQGRIRRHGVMSIDRCQCVVNIFKKTSYDICKIL